MKIKRTRKPVARKCDHSSESGVALLTVVMLLAIFALILVGFTYTIRMEENTVTNYAETVNVQEVTESALQGVLAQLDKDLDPTNAASYLLGREPSRYVSMLDPWHAGYGNFSGLVGGYNSTLSPAPRPLSGDQVNPIAGQSISFDARAFQHDTRPDTVVTGVRDLKYFPLPMPLGIDEDPPGDVTGGRMRGYFPNQRGDGAPGLRGIDDNLDGLIDNSPYPDDDDEDFRVDEDHFDLRRPDLGGQHFFTPGTGYDNDGDSVGVFDESAKININFAGNTFGPGGRFTYNQGVGPHELDLEVFLYNRIFQYSNRGSVNTFSAQQAQDLARQIVNFRYGSVSDGGMRQALPGVDNQDDDNTNNPMILEVEKFSDAYRTSSFRGEPFAIIGNRQDDDGDGLLNEEDEIYIGATTATRAGTALEGPISQRMGDLKFFRPGDGIDNDGDGFIDEYGEGTDDPWEFDVFQPRGDDRPYTSIDDLKLLAMLRNQVNVLPTGMDSPPPSMFNILRDSVTIWNQSDEISGPLSGQKNETAKINPNAAATWRAQDVWDTGRGGQPNHADFQYSPPIALEELFPLQADNDGDWNLRAEPDMERGEADGIDNDGDGQIDEPSDDWDGNYYPSGDWDGYAEPDVGSVATLTSGRDDDGDGSIDEGRQPGHAVGRLRRLPQQEGDFASRPRNPNMQDLRYGVVVEGDGHDNDGDGVIDDIGDFNADGLVTYDPEPNVNEDGFGDASGDGFPGLGAPINAQPGTPEHDIIRPPQRRHSTLITSFADDDRDGFADFYDPQVLAAMYAPEMDGVDNDGDGQVDEIGERYIAAFDDDEDGRYDEDRPEFQLALNLYDYIDSWAPFTVSEDPDVRRELSLSEGDPVLADPVTFFTFHEYSSRQRVFNMHPRLLAGPNQNVRNPDLFLEEMRFLTPNPPELGMPVTYEGVESIRINEVMAKPVIRLQVEDAMERIEYDPANPSAPPVVIPRRGSFFVDRRGIMDDGFLEDPSNGTGVHDTSWNVQYPNPMVPFFPHTFLPEGFRHTINPLMPLINMDALAPAFIMNVTSVAPNPEVDDTIGTQDEIVTFVFENLPAGFYDVNVFLHPDHQLEPEVEYRFNNKLIPMRSDRHVIDPQTMQRVPIEQLSPAEQEIIRRDTAKFDPALLEFLRQGQPGLAPEFRLKYRLSYWPSNLTAYAQRFTDPRLGRVEIGRDGKLTVEVRARTPLAENRSQRPYYVTSIDRIELTNPFAQYVELVNIGTHDIDLGGWTITTPYGHYIIPRDTVIRRMRPDHPEDDGRNRPARDGRHGDGVPFEPLLQRTQFGQALTADDLRLEDNKLLLAYSKEGLKQFIQTNYPGVADLDRIIAEPRLAEAERQAILESVREMAPGGADSRYPNAQLGDINFRVVDLQQDILTHNPAEKMISLYDPAGNYQDSFRYRTTFNNLLVTIPDHGEPNVDLVVLPGYRGMESFERADPTHFITDKQVLAEDDYAVSGRRRVPSSIKLDAKNAKLIDLTPHPSGGFTRGPIGGYVDRRQGVVPDLVVSGLNRFADRNLFVFSDDYRDSWWNGWNFIGDHYAYPDDKNRRDFEIAEAMRNANAMAREAVAPDGSARVRFYDMLGGFENFLDVRNPRDVRYTAFVWRLGLRELIRAGYDPDVDDQLTIRVLGRQFIDRQGRKHDIDMIVGEVMTSPGMRIVDPGSEAVGRQPRLIENVDNPFAIRGGARIPVFAKLRHGDTAFTVNLRETFNALWTDLTSSSGDEPQIEIAVVMRKTTRDLNIPLRGDEVITPEDRPDLARLSGLVFPIADRNRDGYFEDSAGNQLRGGAGDDNYFFRGIEISGRGRSAAAQTENQDRFHRYLAGTPGRDNTGYVPAYPRRRPDVLGSGRDQYDIIDNTAYVKNGMLANIGELSRLHTGNKFETVNTPIIPQRLEDRAVDSNRPLSNAELGQRASSGDNHQYRIQLAQRERLDQWESQYVNLYNIITTAIEGIEAGKININTAPREVLAALPATPPDGPGQLPSLQDRHNFNTIVADFIIEGRRPEGRDQAFGVYGINDDQFMSQFYSTRAAVDTISEFKFRGTGREPRWYKSFDQIRQRRFNPLGITPEDVTGAPINFNNVYLSTIESYPDDGPYRDIGTLLGQISQLSRRERYSAPLMRRLDRTGDVRQESPGDLRERLNDETNRQLTPEDMEAMMGRISNLITVRSRSFTIRSQGRVYDSSGNIVSQRTLETVYAR